MTRPISCPRCNRPVNAQARRCEHCGVDLALAAAVAEVDLSQISEAGTQVPITPELLVPRLGEHLVEQGQLASDQLQRALEYQQEQAQGGEPILLGQALLHLNLIDRETLDQAITEQIMGLQDALKQSNQQLENRVKERTAELEGALERLSELSQLKANFVSNVSHELRTPLAHILGYLDLLTDEALGPLTPEQEGALEVLHKAYYRLQGMIDNLLLFSMVSQGYFTLVEAPVSLHALAKAAIAQSRNKAHERQVALKLSLPEEKVEIQADNEKIHWVLVQLLDNSIKFNNPGGEVELAAEIQDGSARLLVRDNGIGIPTERLDEIFEPFHQLDGSAKRQHAGTGMGLSLVKRILDAHGTRVNVTSERGSGSCVEFTLPIVEERV